MTLKIERVGAHIMVITLNRPEVRNAWNPDMVRNLHAAWKEFAADDALRCCVATGAGPMFTAGLDLKNPTPDGALGMPNLAVPCDKPIIAAVEGAAIGFGSVFCQMADMVFAGRSAYFLYPEAKLGLVQGMMAGFPGRLQYKGALQWLLSADPISAERAREIGLINEVCDDGAAMSRAMAMAEKVAGNAPLVVQAMKAIALGSVPKGPMETHFRINRLIAGVLASEDGQEGLAALREKRKATFKGR